MDFLENGLFGKNFAILGLGDIVVPGIFVALMLRFDCSRGKDCSHVYFYMSYLAYLAGLTTTMVIMHVFWSAQPALLYLVPACVGSALLTSLARGEFMLLYKYKDHPEHMLAGKEEKVDESKIDAHINEESVNVEENVGDKKDN